MKISRRRFTQFLSGLVLAPLAPVVNPIQALSDGDKGLLTKLSLEQMEEMSPTSPGLFPVIPNDAAGNGAYFVYAKDIDAEFRAINDAMECRIHSAESREIKKRVLRMVAKTPIDTGQFRRRS